MSALELSVISRAPEAIVLEQVRVAYGTAVVLDAIDLRVATGEWLALIGPNGAGKTTILRAIAGLAPHGGRIALGGDLVDGQNPKTLARRLAIVSQHPIMPSGMTVAQYVLLGRTPYLSPLGRERSHDRELVATTLARLSLDHLQSRTLESLSGGERQRAAIARALVQDTAILLVDEPTSALDVGRQQEVLDLIDGERRARGLTVVAAMHDLTLAGQYADRLALLEGGQLRACGPPPVVLTEAVVAATYRARVRVRPVGDRVRAVVPDRSMPKRDPHAVPRTAPPLATVKAPSVVLVNTGDGKGKSTAAFGTMLRALARGWPVCVVQFMKSGRWKVGEEQSARRLGAEWWTIGDGFTWDSTDMDRTQAIAREAWRVAREKLQTGGYGLIVLDEITYPINYGWIPAAEVVEAVRTRQPQTNVILTGRDAAEELVACADTVTEMINRKHAFERGVRAIRGIDF